jgi:hypothetical protein
MTHLMEQALVEIGKLPEAEQDGITAITLDEIAECEFRHSASAVSVKR